MAEPYRPVPIAIVVEDHVAFTFTALCRASGANAAQLHALVEEGLLQPTGSNPDDWLFSGPSLRRARQALRLAHDLHLELSGVAIVMDLLTEIAWLRSRLGSR